MKKISQKLFHYPPSPQAAIYDDYHGTKVADPYRWLEDPHSDQTRAWVTAQNELTNRYLAELSVRPEFAKRLEKLWDYPKHTVLHRRAAAYFFQFNDGLKNQPILYRQSSLDAAPEEMLDPNLLSEDGTLALTMYSVSKNGRFLAYNLSQSGSDWQEIHILDLETDREMEEVIRWCKFTPAAWAPDSSGFFYARYPAPNEIPDAPPSTHHRVYYHQLGTSQDEDRLVYARPDAPDLGFQPQVTVDGRYLTLHVWEGTDRRSRFYYQDLENGSDFVRLLDDLDAGYHFIGNDGPLFYFQTDLDAENGRLIAIDATNPQRHHWQTLIPEQSDAIASTLMVNNQFAVVRLHNAHHRLYIHNLDGSIDREIPLPTIGTISEIAGRRHHTELFIQFLSFLYPPTVLRFDFTDGQIHTHHQPQLDFDTTQYKTTQVFYPSKDGTQVPLFLTHKKEIGLDGTHPTLLYGYGGFNISMTPLFSPTRLAWLERGGIYAHACLRGGSEFGESWHQAGILANKQNVFDDFISAAEWLIAQGYTRSSRLAIEGRSNGGLLVAACMVQRPDLFGAIHCGVPVIDMLRYHKFTAGRYWTSEYGNAEVSADDFANLLAYSPLHNIKTGVSNPPTLITSADTDDRVVPSHAKKLAAALQTADPGHNPLLIRIETKAGHGLGKPTHKQIEEAADVYSFLWAALMNGSSETTIKLE